MKDTLHPPLGVETPEIPESIESIRPENGEAAYSPSHRRRFPWINLLLFIATVFTTLLAGALHQGGNPFQDSADWLKGVPFSFTLMAILLTHEMGHYIASRLHRVEATLPFFIPAPPYPFIIGTFGAFIRMKAPITHKRALLDIGAAGPIAGFVVAVAAVAVGLHFSAVVETGIPIGLTLGTPIVFNMISEVIVGPVPDHMDILLHPVAFAGWIGLFVTALNLIPIGQLDGGHIVYALMGKRHRAISLVMILFLVTMGVVGWPGWLLWAAIPLLFGIHHPPVMDADVEIGRSRRVVGWISLAIFVTTFVPIPISG